ncbi:MAG: hypothetical protein AAF830_11340 [Pseudomonadota bacterium]
MKIALAAAAATACLFGAAQANSVAFVANGTDSIYLSGDGSYTGDGTAPFTYSFTPGGGQVLSFFDIVGFTNCCSSTPDTNADGENGGNSNVDGSAGISGIVSPGQLFFAGVFIDSGNPPSSGSTPADLDFFSIGTDFTSLAPALNQAFFIGNGLTSTFQVQEFLIPDSADTLVLGFIDAFAFTGAPGFYDDNTGSLSGDFEITGGSAPVPVPGALPLMVAGLAIGAMRQRAKA